MGKNICEDLGYKASKLVDFMINDGCVIYLSECGAPKRHEGLEDLVRSVIGPGCFLITLSFPSEISSVACDSGLLVHLGC